MKALIFSTLITLALTACAAPVAVVIGGVLVDGIVQAERGQPSHITKGVSWACGKVDGAMTPAGDCEKGL